MAADIPDAPPFAGHACPVLSLAFNPSATVLASGGFDGVIRLWDGISWEQTAELSGHTWPVAAMAFNSDGTVLASASDRGGIRLWDTRTGRQVTRFPSHDTSVRAMGWDQDDLMLITIGTDETVERWNTATGAQTRVRSLAQSSEISAAAIGSIGTRFATGNHDGGVQIGDTREGGQDIASYIRSRAPLSAMAWTAAGPLAAADQDGGVWLWEAKDGPGSRQFTVPGPVVRSIAFSPAGADLAVGDENGGIRIWDSATGQQSAELTGHAGHAYAVAYSPDGAAIATGGTDGITRIWDSATGRQTAQLTGHTAAVRDVAYSQDGTTLVTASNDCTARVSDSATGQLRAECTGQVNAINAVAISPDGTKVATGGNDHTVRLYNSATGQGLAEFTRHANPVTAVAFNPLGSQVASGATTVRIWGLNDDHEIAHLIGHGHGITDLAWSPDGSLLATSAGGVRIWDTGTWQQIARLTGHGSFVGAIAWSPDGATIASTGLDGTIRLWDAATWQKRLELTGHSGIVRGLAWSPDGRALASVSDDGTIRTWNPRDGIQAGGTPQAAVRALAGVRSDIPSGEDLLGVGDDVETLAELIAATETSPPLAIALIGDWGTGKSSVMLQVEQHIDVLAQRAQDNPGRSAFAANVRQIRFNAWHYSDDHLWTGIVSHLFKALAESPGDSGQQEVSEESEKLRADLDTMQAESREAAVQVEKIQGPTVATWLGAPLLAGRVLRTAVRQAVRDARTARFGIVAWVVLGIAAYLAWRFMASQVAATVTAIAALTPLVVTVTGKLKSARNDVESLAKSQQTDIDREISAIRDRLARIDGEFALERFLEVRSGAESYGEYRGLLGQVHDDLKELSGDLARARGKWAKSGRKGPPPLERIVLYIDDLDRCPPRRVVKVLEAVHLMLALDLFVVVVAVDARWLIRSLGYHHQELFAEGDASGEAVATPVDYLDKIFQIPFALRPPGPEATANYLRSLLPDPVPPGDAPSSGSLADSTSFSGSPADDILPGGVPHADQSPSDRPQANPNPANSPSATVAIGDRDFMISSAPPAAERAAAVPAIDEEPVAAAPLPELRPQSLRLSQPEVEFMTSLGGLVPTPRAAKRLVNLYRLVRIGIPDSQLSVFTSEGNGPYRAVQVLLAILVGHPKAARALFSWLLTNDADGDLAAVIESTQQTNDSIYLIKNELTKLFKEQALIVSTAECRRWFPLLARFSFYTRDLARQPHLASGDGGQAPDLQEGERKEPRGVGRSLAGPGRGYDPDGSSVSQQSGSDDADDQRGAVEGPTPAVAGPYLPESGTRPPVELIDRRTARTATTRPRAPCCWPTR